MVFLDPAAVGTATGVERLDFRILHETVRRKVEPQDGAGAEASVTRDRLRRDVEHARLGGEDEESVLRKRPPRGAEAVAVERRANADAVREGDGGGAVPRLHERGMVFVEGADVMAHVVFHAPGLRDEHHHRVRRVAAGRNKQLEHVVERGGIALPLPDDGQELLQLVAEERRGERRFARREGVEVALERVDFAVVGDGAEGMGQLPGREGVGRVALVDDREGRNEVRIGEVGVELLDLRGQQQPLVDDCPRRAGADVGLLRRLLDLPADYVEPSLEVYWAFPIAVGSRLQSATDE